MYVTAGLVHNVLDITAGLAYDVRMLSVTNVHFQRGTHHLHYKLTSQLSCAAENKTAFST
jgi:hypothetical protein